MGNDWDAYCVPDAYDIEVAPIDGVSGLFNVQEWIEYLLQTAGDTVKPGATWGRSGNCPPDTWLLNETVTSNKTGRVVFLYNAVIKRIFVGNKDATVRDISVYSHDGDEINLTLIMTVTTAAARSEDFSVSYPVARGKHLAVRIGSLSSNAAKEPLVGILMDGTLTP